MVDVFCSAYCKQKGEISFLGENRADVASSIGSMLGRPVIALSLAGLGYAGPWGALRWFFSSDDRRIKEVLDFLQFDSGALEGVYRQLGKGDKALGKKRFLGYVRKGQITAERIGFSKGKKGWDGKSLPKFYLIINQSKGQGGFNTFSIGFSRRGAARAVLKPLCKDGVNEPSFFVRSLKGDQIAAIKNVENGVKAAKLGGKDLFCMLEKASSTGGWIPLSKSERLLLYKNLFVALDEIHQQKGVHGDMKLENMVWRTSKSSKDKKVMAIDLDNIKKAGESCNSFAGTPVAFSPSRMKFCCSNFYDCYPADPKDDIWSAMCMICQIEQYVSPSERLLSPEWITRFSRYEKLFGRPKTLEESLKSMGNVLGALKKKANLFFGLEPDSHYPMDRIVQAAAATNPKERWSAEELLKEMDQMISFNVLDQIYHPPAPSTEGHGILNSIRRIFSAL